MDSVIVGKVHHCGLGEGAIVSVLAKDGTTGPGGRRDG